MLALQSGDWLAQRKFLGNDIIWHIGKGEEEAENDAGPVFAKRTREKNLAVRVVVNMQEHAANG